MARSRNEPDPEVGRNGNHGSGNGAARANGRAVRCGHGSSRNRHAGNALGSPGDHVGIVGRHPKIIELLSTLEKVAVSDAPVLISGETGTGKELVARAIHKRSGRPGPFLAVNCGAVPPSLEESEFFGSVPGAFTGADRDNPGWFVAAHGGTLLLDEIGDASPGLQAKLLRVLEGGVCTPVGTRVSQTLDVRVVAATNRDLRAAVEAGSFRDDLYYRLSVMHLHVPPLRERKSDIPLLVEHFLRRCSARRGAPEPSLGADAHDVLLQHDYPGNVRELASYAERVVALGTCTPVTAETIEEWIAAGPRLDETVGASDASAAPPPERRLRSFHEEKRRVVDEFERRYLVRALMECRGNIRRAAKRTDLSERVFHRKLKTHGIRGVNFRAPNRAD